MCSQVVFAILSADTRIVRTCRVINSTLLTITFLGIHSRSGCRGTCTEDKPLRCCDGACSLLHCCFGICNFQVLRGDAEIIFWWIPAASVLPVSADWNTDLYYMWKPVLYVALTECFRLLMFVPLVPVFIIPCRLTSDSSPTPSILL